MAAFPSVGKDSGKSTTDLGPIGEGLFFFSFPFSLFIFNLVLHTPSIGPLPDDGIRFYFILRLYFNTYLDIKMASPPNINLQGSSRTTGGHIRGNAPGNKPNHADLALDNYSSAHMLVQPKLTFKIFVHIQFGEVLMMNRVPDFESQFPITVFMLQGTSLLTKPLLERAVGYHASISGKYYLLLLLFTD